MANCDDKSESETRMKVETGKCLDFKGDEGCCMDQYGNAYCEWLIHGHQFCNAGCIWVKEVEE